MVARARDKIALLVFVVLLLLGAAISIGYFFTSRSWNVAATVVDDTMGRLNGYVVLVYNGVIEPDRTVSGVTAAANDASTIEDLPLPEEVQAQENAEAYFASDLNRSYAENGASVLTLNLGTLQHYEEPTIYRLGDRRIGVFSLTSYKSRSELEALHIYFRQHEAQCVVCLTSDVRLLTTKDWVNAIIVTEADDDIPTTGVLMDGTFVVMSPEVGSVGVMMITSTNVISAYTIDTAQR